MVLPILMLCYPNTAPQLLHNDLYNNSGFSSAFFCLHSGYLGNTGVKWYPYKCSSSWYIKAYLLETSQSLLWGICRGYDAWLHKESLQVRVSAGSPSGLAWSLYKCAALWRAVYGPSAIKRPLGTIREEKGHFFQALVFYLIAIWPKLCKATWNPMPFFPYCQCRCSNAISVQVHYAMIALCSSVLARI